MSRRNRGTGGSPVSERNDLRGPTVPTGVPGHRIPRFVALSLIVVALTSVGLWWFLAPW